MLTTTDLIRTVEQEIRVLLEDTLDEVDTISATDSLSDLGLNSLTLARLIIALEMEIGVDPFSADRSIADVRTVADLARAYDEALREVAGTTAGLA